MTTDQLLHAERTAITITGTPIAQGSKVANRHGGGVRDANATKLKPWRAHVRAAAEDATRYTARLDGPVRIWIRFTFDRPPTHYGTGRGRHTLRPAALRDHPFPGHSCGDIDKLTRAILDALTDAQVWADDTQVVDLRARKFYAGEHELARPAAGVDIILEAA